jgi:hypothetical protein
MRRQNHHLAEHDHPDRANDAEPRRETPAAPRHHHLGASFALAEVVRRAVVASPHLYLLVAGCQVRAMSSTQQPADGVAEAQHRSGYAEPHQKRDERELRPVSTFT